MIVAPNALAPSWQLRTQTLSRRRLPLLMGVVNVTPDSFSDGGKFLDDDVAVEHALWLVHEGADVLDIGGESTRPGAESVAAAEQIARVVPVIERVARRTSVPISVDTSLAAVAAAALDAGAEAVNDITALRGDCAMAELVARTQCGVCLMHMQGVPRTMQLDPRYDDVVGEVLAFLGERVETARAAGIDRARIALDPGIGFGKHLAHNHALLRHADALHQLGCAVLVGPSRKRFIAATQEDTEAERVSGTIGAALALARRGVHVLRVHDVGAVRRALKVFEAAGGFE